MTKMVRVENADTSTYKVIVEVWAKGHPEGEPDKLINTYNLDYPTRMQEIGIHSTQWLVVKEA